MLKHIDSFLNPIPMYRLVLYTLIVLAAISILLGATGFLVYTPVSFVISLFFCVIFCTLVNRALANLYKAQTNTESATITGLILFFLLKPVENSNDLLVTFIACFTAMASKYIFAKGKIHFFNPGAFGIWIIGLLGSGNALWWAGSASIALCIIPLGLLIIRKIRRFHLVGTFVTFSATIIVVQQLAHATPLLSALISTFTQWPLLFFAFIMLTEPITTPPTKKLQILYGALIGILFTLQFHVGLIFSTPELALLIGNGIFFVIAPRQRLMLRLKDKKPLSDDIYEYVFASDERISFHPGQYLEWTLPHKPTDSRGNRRYFTIASSPTEKNIHLGVKIPSSKKSTFKTALSELNLGDKITASQISGDFILPKDKQQKIVWIAGGIGVTPFRSMAQYLVDSQETRDIVLFFTAMTRDGFAFHTVFDTAARAQTLRPIYVITQKQHAPNSWKGEVGYITQKMIVEHVPDYQERLFYISGPQKMVDAYKVMLTKLSVSPSKVITDYFPGF